jgi:hypothetical protein
MKKNNVFKLSVFLLTGLIVIASCKKEDAKIKLSVPENVRATTDMGFKIRISWNKVKDATAYDVYRSTTYDSASFTIIGSTADTIYNDTTVTSGSFYNYIVVATAGGGSASFRSYSAYGYCTGVISAGEAFDDLAKATGGSVYVAEDATDVPDMMLEIIAAHIKSGADLVFLIDQTGSMSNDIDSIRAATTLIINSLPANTQVGVATFGDEECDGTAWYSSFNLSSNFTAVKEFINGIYTTGGCDEPESMFDGIWYTVDRMSWRSTSTKFMIVISDAPPLTAADRTTYTEAQVVAKCKSAGINVAIYPILVGGYYKKKSASNQ